MQDRGCVVTQPRLALTVSKSTLAIQCMMPSYPRRRLLLLSNSTLHPSPYLAYASQHISAFLGGAKRVLFVPFALRDADSYAQKVRDKFAEWGVAVDSLHEHEDDPVAAVKGAEAIFVGGGNTFQLIKGLQDRKLVEVIRKRVLEEGVPYMGSSAGTNVATVSIHVTNDMPIVYPSSFSAIGLVPFNINPHYLDADPNSSHQGETREERIRQYLEIPGVPPVLALREGSLLSVEGDKIVLKGDKEALLFKADKSVDTFAPESDLSFLLNMP